jgi:uncharacterized membrane protein YphA (DoxX/SURF4 family)
MIRRFLHWLFWDEGSSRTAGLLRIALPLLLWDRWASDLILYKAKDELTLLVAISFYLSTLLLLFGIASRFTAAWTAATMLVHFYWLGVGHAVDAYTHHHAFLLVCYSVLLVFTPCGRSFSVDRWLALRRAAARGGEAPPEWGPLWGLRLLAMQISAIYVWATYDKVTTPAFLTGERMQHVLLERYWRSDPAPFAGFEALCLALAIGTVIMEGALAVGLWIPRVRGPLAAVGVVFHGILYIVLPVGPFSATMAALYLAFFDPDTVHRVTARLAGGPSAPPLPARETGGEPAANARASG